MSSLYAQSDIEREVITQFQQDFNAQNYAAIFEKFSPEAKKAIPLNMFEKVSKDLQQQLGKIQSLEYIESKGKETAVYKANFEKDRLKLSMSLNNDQQISSLYLRPISNLLQQIIRQSMLFKAIQKRLQRKFIRLLVLFQNKLK